MNKLDVNSTLLEDFDFFPRCIYSKSRPQAKHRGQDRSTGRSRLRITRHGRGGRGRARRVEERGYFAKSCVSRSP
ncbi:BQ5605_C004g02962 [Microbotryum silenes-dioicae]|uniref:BQ5605_C004g02962 protein n=1 Tax=Microbotryum silenes-dioicae TaxID=796604 RepID=A0A2X0MWF8_9BASI|nr:BQ5605_C004g02962 [Microbotryum silenes-dioicae]